MSQNETIDLEIFYQQRQAEFERASELLNEKLLLLRMKECYSNDESLRNRKNKNDCVNANFKSQDQDNFYQPSKKLIKRFDR